jgi:hypothetical protein
MKLAIHCRYVYDLAVRTDQGFFLRAFSGIAIHMQVPGTVTINPEYAPCAAAKGAIGLSY